MAPRARMDVGLPLECTVAELVPQLVRMAGAPAHPTADSSGWVLSRVGEQPLSPGLTVSAASLRDGEVLNLRPRPKYEAPLLFDDVVDAIASAAQSRRGAWRPRVGRRLGVGAAVALVIGAALFLVAAWEGTSRLAIGAGVLAICLLVVGGALERALGDPGAASACCGGGLFVAFLAGTSALPPHTVWPLEVDSLAVGFGVVTVYGAVAAMVVVHRLAWFAAAAAAAAGGALITSSVLLFDAELAHAVTIATVVVTALTAMAPMISLRLARIPLPHVPADMESFREDEQPALGSEVLGVTSMAAQILTGLVTALGSIAIGCCAVLLAQPGWFWLYVLIGLVGLAWILRSRSYAGAAQRVAPVVVGLVILTGLGTRMAITLDTDWLIVGAALLVLAAALCLFYASRVVRNVHSPFRARWLDWLEYLVLIAFVPVGGAVLGLYNGVRDAVS
ncbi:type VII secretion integral membrane protein EccD [Labedaea rhizosphaerae]|uniref:type VII secretion integral membrane protein EccD n=1 Tax=Labedaea rhizosphaerae TaxID=598644 RepID=UPI001FB58D91|nr:type VII secretion integral membrane protein EccD [Labedaea rhizosphaerae]